VVAVKVLITLGWFDDSGEGRLVEVDLARGTQDVRLAYVPPELLRVAGKGFTGAAWSGDAGTSTLLVCGYCALYHVAAESWAVDAIWHQPCWNDLHHVAVADERVYVVNTGLECVDVLTKEGQFVGSYALHPGWLSAARQAGYAAARADLPALRDARWWQGKTLPASEEPSTEYYSRRDGDGTGSDSAPFAVRKVRDYIHPNHVAIHNDRLLVTRFLDRSIGDLSSFRPIIAETPGLPHDGLVVGDRFWITCVNGLVVAYALDEGRVTGREVERIDVFATGHTGWCRGLAVTSEHVIVGLTAIRRMPRERWCERPFEDTETSVLCIERATGRLAQRVVLDGVARHPKIFSVLML